MPERSETNASLPRPHDVDQENDAAAVGIRSSEDILAILENQAVDVEAVDWRPLYHAASAFD